LSLGIRRHASIPLAPIPWQIGRRPAPCRSPARPRPARTRTRIPGPARRMRRTPEPWCPPTRPTGNRRPAPLRRPDRVAPAPRRDGGRAAERAFALRAIGTGSQPAPAIAVLQPRGAESPAGRAFGRAEPAGATVQLGAMIHAVQPVPLPTRSGARNLASPYGSGEVLPTDGALASGSFRVGGHLTRGAPIRDNHEQDARIWRGIWRPESDSWSTCIH
jgi:hypothetical protein